jgi:hypothetical protein
MYKITIGRKIYRFDTLDKARKVANEIFQKTGVVVGIESIRVD